MIQKRGIFYAFYFCMGEYLQGHHPNKLLNFAACKNKPHEDNRNHQRHAQGA